MPGGPQKYQAGACNIGRQEIQYRKRVVGYGSGLVGLALYIMFVFFNVPIALYPFILIPVFISIHGFNEAKHKFCTNYGRNGKYNMTSEVGMTQNVLSGQKRNLDNKLANRLVKDSLWKSLVISGVLIAVSRLVN